MPIYAHILIPPFSEMTTTPGFLRALDRASRNRSEWPEAGVQQLYKVLRRRGTLGDVCARFGLFRDEEDERHLREDWLGEGGHGWWPKEPMEAMLRTGMIRAVQLLRQYDLPLASYWRVGKGMPHVQITFAVSRQQITLVISTPPPRVRAARGRVVRNPKIWVITHRGSRIISAAARTPVPDEEPRPNPIPCLV
jgi:hypothetical protein